MKALVLAGGRGSRLKELTENRNKCLHEFRGRTLIEYSLENAKAAAVDEIIIVVSYRAESIINRYGNIYKGIPVQYVIQWERKGLVHAIECSEEAIDGSDFILFLADEVLLETKHAEMIRAFRDQQAFTMCGSVWVENRDEISKTYSIIYDTANGRIYRLIEKPRQPMNNIMGTGNCVFNNKILEYIPYTPINHQRGEKELPDLIQAAIDDGQLVKIFDVGGNYINVNTVEDLDALEHSWSASGFD